MLADEDAFLAQLKSNEHLYLFSASSLEPMLADFGVAEVRRKEAMFSHYDQFVVNGKSALENHSVFLKLANAVPAQRLVQALLDARVAYREMEQEWQDAEADREARLAVIQDVTAKLQASEADREARLQVIQAGGSHWKSEKDYGQSNAINCGLRQATGEFAPYVNSDDLYAPGAFAVVAEASVAPGRIPARAQLFHLPGRIVHVWLSILVSVCFVAGIA